MEIHCVLKIFLKPSCVKNSPATGVRKSIKDRIEAKYIHKNNEDFKDSIFTFVAY